MKRTLFIIAAALTAGCSRNPNEVAQRNIASADKYVERGQFREAAILYRRAIATNPRLAVAYAKLTDVYLRSNAIGQTIAPLRRAIELLPEGPERNHRRVQLADILLTYTEERHRDQSVIEEVERLASALGESYEGWRVRGRLSTILARGLAEQGGIIASSKEVREAIVLLEKAEAARPLTEGVTIPLARSLWVENERPRALDLLRAFTTKHPDSTVGWSDLARFLEMDRKADEADAVLRSAIRANPKHYSFTIRLAAHWRNRGDARKMEDALADLRATEKENPLAHEQVAGFYRHAREWDKAVAEYEAAKAQHPKFATRFDLYISDVYMAAGRRDQARERIAGMLKRAANDPVVRVRYAAMLFEDGKAPEAVTELEAIVRAIPTDFAAHYNLGRARRRVGQLEMARIALQDAVRLNGSYPPAIAELMSVQVEMGQWGNALLTSEKYLEQVPGDPKAGLVRAAAFRSIGKYDEARAQLATLRSWGAPEGVRLLELGRLERALGRDKAARETYLAAYAAGSVEALIESANLLGDPAKAFASLEAECAKRAGTADLQLACADFAVLAGRLEPASAVYERALAQTKEPVQKVDLHLRAGEALRRAKRIDAALAHFEQAAKLQPDNAIVNHQLAVTYDQLSRPKEAMAAYDRSIKANPDNAVALNNLAWHLYQSGGNLDVAQTYAQRAHQLAPNQLEFADTLGMIYLKKNLRENAKAIFRDLVSKSPENAEFKEHLRQAESGG